MTQDNVKNNIVSHGFIELGKEEGKGKGRYFQSRFIEPGIAHYDEFGDVLITKETLDKFISTMIGCPVIINHKDVDDSNVDKLRVGTVSRVWFNDIDGWYYCEGILTDAQAIDLVKNENWSVSCSYDFVSDNLKKTYHGKDIDMEFIDGEFLHLAIVENPRYERATIVINSKDETKKDIVNNNIEEKENTIMSVMDDLKAFILSVVNNEAEKEEKKMEDEEKFEEEKDIATNEDDEEEKEEKAENKKVKNKCKNEEEDKKEDVENEDDEEEEKEKVENEEDKEDKEEADNEEEDKEEEKAENKCAKNSMDKIKEAIEGGRVEEKSFVSYSSQAERLALGNKF